MIPSSPREDMLKRLHTGHQGIVKCRERARQSVRWPGLSAELQQLVRNCYECRKEQSQHAEPLIISELPKLPFQKVGTDLFDWQKRTYLLLIDYYSRYIEIALLNRPSAEEVIAHMKCIFARHGIPELVMSDNGPQYSCEAFAEFVREYHFRHVTSSPQSNGESENHQKSTEKGG